MGRPLVLVFLWQVAHMAVRLFNVSPPVLLR